MCFLSTTFPNAPAHPMPPPPILFDQSLIHFLRQSPGEQVSLLSAVYVQNPSYLNRLCMGIFINFTAFVIDSCKAWKIYNLKIRLGE